MHIIKTKSFKNRLALLVCFLAIISGTTTVNAQGNQASLRFSPELTTATVGEIFTTDIVINTAGNQAVGADAKIIFDAGMVEVTQVEAGDIFADYPLLAHNNQTGRIAISGIVSGPSNLYSGTGVFARIHWRGLNPGDAIATFEFVPGDTRDSNIAVLTGNNEALEQVNSLIMILEGDQPVERLQPIVQPTPSPDTTGVASANPTPAPTPQPSPTPSPTPKTGVVGTITNLIGGIFGTNKSSDNSSETPDGQVISDLPVEGTVDESSDPRYAPISRNEPQTDIDEPDSQADKNQVEIADTVTGDIPATQTNQNNSPLPFILAIVIIITLGVGVAGVVHKSRKKGEKVIRL